MMIPSRDAMHEVAHNMDKMLDGCLLDEILCWFSDMKEDEILADIAKTWDIPYEEMIENYERKS